MSIKIQTTSQPKEPFHRRNGSEELDVFEAANYFSGASEVFPGTCKNVSGEARVSSNNTQKYCMKPMRRMSLDMPNNIQNPIPLQAMLMENSNNEKKSKHPSSPGGKLAHFLNSLFSQTSSKKSKSKSKTKSTKDEDDSSGGWRRKRRSSISHFMSGNSNSTITTITSDSKSLNSTSRSSGFQTPPTYHIAHTPTKTTRSYSDHKHLPSQITKMPINRTLNKIENFHIKRDLSEKKMSFGTRFVEKVKIFEEKQEEYHPHKQWRTQGNESGCTCPQCFEK